MNRLNNYETPEGCAYIGAPPPEDELYSDEREEVGILSEIQLLDNAFVTDQNEHSDVNRTPEMDFLTGDGLPNTVKYLDEYGNIATMGHEDFPLEAPQMKTIFDVFEASQPLFLRDEELRQISDQIQELAQELFTAIRSDVLDKSQSSHQRIYTMADKLKEKTAPFYAKANKKRTVLTRQTQEKLLEELKNNLPELAEALKLDIGIYAYREYFFQQKYKAFYDFPPDERSIEKAVVVKRTLEQCSFTDLRQELLNNPLVSYCGIQIYWSYIKENDSALFEELKQYRDTVLKFASSLSDVQQANREAWEKILIATGSELPTVQVEQVFPVYDRYSPMDKITQNIFNGKLTAGKNVCIKTGDAKKNMAAFVKIDNIKDIAPFDAFDRVVNAACYSLYLAGNSTQSFVSIARVMTGKESNYNPPPKLIRDIQASCIKQMNTLTCIDSTNEAKYYPKITDPVTVKNIFTARMVLSKYNNSEDAGSIQFFLPPVNAEYADKKNQIEKINIRLLDTGVPQTTENIMLQEILLDKITIIKRTSKGKYENQNYIDYANIAEELLEQLERRKSSNSGEPSKSTANSRSVQKNRIKKKIPQFLDAWKGHLFKSYKEVYKNDKKKTVIGARIQRLIAEKTD